MAPAIPSSSSWWSARGWGAKQYILAALLGGVVVATVAAAICISLAPARISFSIADATTTRVPVDVEHNTHVYDQFYNFTLVANNTSRRTSVWYGSLSAEIWYSETEWIPTDDVATAAEVPTRWRPPGDIVYIPVSAEWGQYSEKANGTAAPPPPPSEQSKPSNSSSVVVVKWPYCRVVVEAKVWFHSRAITRPYTIRVSCYPVNFINARASFPVPCIG